MARPDAIEFHVGNRCILEIDSSHAPDRGDKVNINKRTYKVIGRSYTIDHAYDGPALQKVYCIINLEELLSEAAA